MARLRVPPRLFVTGTDTGAGKTVVTAALAAAAPGPCRAGKICATGVAAGTAGQDAELLGRAAGHPPLVGPRFTPPLSPHRAAALAGRRLDLEALADLARGWALEAARCLVEGVGGFRVPLGWTFDVRDLAVALGWPVLVVAPDRLGVLNHVILTVDAVRGAGLPLVGVVLSEVPGAGPEDTEARRWNGEDLRRLLDPLPVARLPRLPALDRATLREAGRRLGRPVQEDRETRSRSSSTTSGA